VTGIAAKYGFPIENDSGEPIPPYSVVKVTGVTTSDDQLRTWSVVEKFDATAGNIMVTGAVTIPSQMTTPGGSVNGRGTAYYDQFVVVAIDPDAAEPVSGEEWGPVDGEWFIGPTGSGFVSQGFTTPPLDGIRRGLFYRKSAATGGAQIVRFTLETTDCDSYEGATGTVVEVMCGGTSGVSVGDTIALEDPLDYLVGNPQLITGAKGMATKMGDACSWEIISMGQLGYNC